jgi:3-oxoadipate enol-lactonase
MPELRIDDGLTMHYENHYFGEAWLQPETIMLVHGVAESGRAWDQWVPHLSRHYRVIRPDLRGFGKSTIPPADYIYQPEKFATELAAFVRGLNLGPVHVVGAKIGGTVTMQFAADYPELTRSASVFSGPVRSRHTGGSADLTTFEEWVRSKGVRTWAAETMRARLGNEASDELIEYWTDFMAECDEMVCISIQVMVQELDISDSLGQIKAPVLIGTTEKSALASVEVVREWQQLIAGSELVVLPGDSYHVAVVRADDCAEKVLEFIQRRAS